MTDKKGKERTQDTDVYDRWAQAVSSASELVESACYSARSLCVPQFLTAVLPVVVVPDGVLWEVVYDDNGAISTDPAQVKECEFFIGRRIAVGVRYTPQFLHLFTFSHVHFFTLEGFGSFLSRIAVNEHAWAKLFAERSIDIR